MTERREIAVRVPRGMLLGMRVGSVPHFPALPPDVKVVRMIDDPWTGCVYAVLAHESFERVQDGACVPLEETEVVE